MTPLSNCRNRSTTSVLGLALSFALVVGCAPVSDTRSSVDDQTAASSRLAQLNALDERVARVAYRLTTANAELCPTVRHGAGWALHAAKQYSGELRALVETRHNLRGDLPGVLVVPPTSPAELAGVRPGDLIIAVNGAPLPAGDLAGAPRFEGFAANLNRVDSALAEGETEITLEREGDLRTVRILAQRACGYDVQVNPSDDLNARADGRRLFISTALAQFAESDDELAVILGHELAHHVLRHRQWSDVGGLGRSANEGAGVDAVGDPERQADRVGLYLSARAGFDPSVAAPFWRRFGASNWRVRYPQLAHASAETRARRLGEVAEEIRGLQAAGQALRP